MDVDIHRLVHGLADTLLYFAAEGGAGSPCEACVDETRFLVGVEEVKGLLHRFKHCFHTQ